MAKSPIKIKNLYYMLCYVIDYPMNYERLINFDQIKDDNIYDLLALLFCVATKRIIKGGFHKSYVNKTEDLSIITGQINIFPSIQNHINGYRALNCSYDDFTENDIFNQILKYTLVRIARNKYKHINKDIAKEARYLCAYFINIDEAAPDKNNLNKLIFQKNNHSYHLLINVSKMLYDDVFINEDEEIDKFKDADRENRLYMLYEKFLRNFYAKHLDPKLYVVDRSKIEYINPKISKVTTYAKYFEIEEKMGIRETDITITRKDKRLQMILDAKFYTQTLVQNRGSKVASTYQHDHINQIRCYLRDSKFRGRKIGALLYPYTNVDFSKGQLFNINELLVIKTINLNDDWSNISKDLLDFIERLEATALA